MIFGIIANHRLVGHKHLSIQIAFLKAEKLFNSNKYTSTLTIQLEKLSLCNHDKYQLINRIGEGIRFPCFNNIFCIINKTIFKKYSGRLLSFKVVYYKTCLVSLNMACALVVHWF